MLAGGDFDHSFTTLPQTGTNQPLRFWVAGDTGNGSQVQMQAFDAMRAYTAADGRPVDAFLHLGDMAYSVGLDSEFSTNYFQIYTQLLRNTVAWPTMGNHEGYTSNGLTQVGPYYDAFAVPTQGEAGGVPSGSEGYYSFDHGNVHLICLNSYDIDRSPTGEMALWLKADLEMTNADWLIAFWHHPPYTKGTHDSDREVELIEMRQHIMPMLESAGVDLVLTGHSHVYERSMLIDGAYETPTVAEGVILDDGDGNPLGNGPYKKSASLNPNEGTVAIVAGNGRSAAIIYGLSPVMRSTVRAVGSVLIDIDGDVLTGRMLDNLGGIRDEFQIVKQGVVVPEIVEHPWQPHGPAFLVERFEPGTDWVEIHPGIGAPDLVSHYTLDISYPTAESPVYTGPIPIAEGGRIAALSIWSGGEREGPAWISGPAPLWPSLLRFPSSPADDAIEDAFGDVSTDDETLTIGLDGTIGLRYTDVRIPPGALIVKAEVDFYKAALALGFESNPSTGVITAEAIADSPPFEAQPFNLSSRSQTAAAVSWTVRTWSGIQTRDLNTKTTDLGPIITELINQPGWQSGNALTLLFKHPGGPRTAGSFDSGKPRAPTLAVAYIDPTTIADELASQALELFRDPSGRVFLRLRWLRPDVATALGINGQIEFSTGLDTWSITNPISESFANVSENGFASLIVEIDPALPSAHEDLFFRIHITQTLAP